jgi:hypothetical protein
MTPTPDEMVTALDFMAAEPSSGQPATPWIAVEAAKAIVRGTHPIMQARVEWASTGRPTEPPWEAIWELTGMACYETAPGRYACRTCDAIEESGREDAHDPGCEATIVREWLRASTGRPALNPREYAMVTTLLKWREASLEGDASELSDLTDETTDLLDAVASGADFVTLDVGTEEGRRHPVQALVPDGVMSGASTGRSTAGTGTGEASDTYCPLCGPIGGGPDEGRLADHNRIAHPAPSREALAEALRDLFEQAIRLGIDSETDFYGNGQNVEEYIRRPARDYTDQFIARYGAALASSGSAGETP